ncbi:unnamed protein product, partial [Ectocarpus sp. 8 AP-2014]
ERDDRVQRGDDLRRVRQRNEEDPGQDGRRIGGGGGRACEDGDGVERWIHDEAGHAGRLAEVVRGQRQERRARQLEEPSSLLWFFVSEPLVGFARMKKALPWLVDCCVCRSQAWRREAEGGGAGLFFLGVVNWRASSLSLLENHFRASVFAAAVCVC